MVEVAAALVAEAVEASKCHVRFTLTRGRKGWLPDVLGQADTTLKKAVKIQWIIRRLIADLL